jgi:hypothetical protein
MNTIKETITHWADRYPGRFSIRHCKAKEVGSHDVPMGQEGLAGVCLSTSGRKSQDDVPSLLDVWIALDGSLAFRVMTDEDNHHTPDADALLNSDGSESGLIASLEAAVTEFCGRYDLAEQDLRATSQV